MKIKLALAMLCTGVVSAFAANEVQVHINSGNPNFPFPQFLGYECGDNLGTKNPEGVVHAEMEQDIRDAYQIFANEWEYTGETVGGVKYIRGNIGCPYDCREGDGYSLLASAIMADKVSFDGLWMRLHDNFRVKRPRYSDGVVVEPNYGYGDLAIKDNANSATDGDVDIALALYVAWRQWGDDSGIKVAGGGNFSYKQEMIDVIRGLVAMSTRFPTENPQRCNTGEIGFDGYMKNGDTWTEITPWASQAANYLLDNGISKYPEFGGPQDQHTDYSAPAYFHEFYELLEALNLPESSKWESEQYRRAAASCDWMVGNWISQNAKNIFVGETAKISNSNVVTLDAGNQGGRFRSPWRTALNYVWHGNPTYTWNPTTHKVEDGGNTYELDACKHFTGYMNNPQEWGGAACTEFGGGPSLTYNGPATLQWDINPDGTSVKSAFTLNWIPGCGMPSAIGAQDMDLAGLLYRQCAIEWDIVTGGDGYITSVPHYFHGFFRLLGMLIGTGNHQAPSKMIAGANMKIYRAIEDSVTFAYTGDQLTYLLDYRNYGAVDAKNVVIVENVPEDFVFVSASDGGVYNAAKHTITWNIGTVPGVKSDDVAGPKLNLKSGNLAKTIGQVSYVCRVGPKAFGRYCTTADITCSNGTGWTTNEYPNYITATMQRSCVDVIKRALKIEKTANLEKVNPGNIVEYKIDFENSSEAGWLDGGRPRVNVAVANKGLGSTQQWLYFRLYSDAIEPYINYGNYRIAYYLYDSNLKCLAGEDDCIDGWNWYTAVYEGKRSTSDKVTVSHETIVEGSDERGKWNQRLCIQFAPLLVTTTAHLSNYYGMGARIHKGGTEPLRVTGYINPSNWAATDFSDDWSWDAAAKDAEDGNYFPVSPSWQNIDPETGKSIEIPVKEYLPNVCEKPKHSIENILVEEYDGYVWRRILGTGPMAGREAKDVVVIDTLPKGMDFVAFQNKCPLEDYGASWNASKIADGRWVVKWEIPLMQVKQKGSIIYTATASFPSGKECQTDDELTQNVAWILADKNSPLSDTAEVVVTCAKVPKPIVPTTLEKLVDKEEVMIGDEVTYTINYEQTHGFTVEDALKNASDWTTKNTSISGGTVTVGQAASAQYNNSLHNNIYVKMHCNVSKYEHCSFYLRDNVVVEMNPQWSDIGFTCTQGGKTLKDAKINTRQTEFDLIIDLTDDILRIWFDKDTTNSADFTAEGVAKKEGYFGFKGIGGQYKFSNIYVHTDYAYDLYIIDKKPAEITFGEAKNGGKLEGDSIVWKFEQGFKNPIKFGTKYTVTWVGSVAECDETIINEAYVKLLGHSSDEIRAQVSSKCITEEECEGVQKATLEIADSQICEGGKTVIRATASPEGKYEYEFFLDDVSLGEASKIDTMVVAEAGKYKVKVSDPACEDAAPVTTKSVELLVNPLPNKKIAEDQTLCGDEKLDLSQFTESGYDVKWFLDEDTLIAITELTMEASEANNAYYYTLTDKKTGCVSVPTSIAITVNEIPATPTVTDKEYPMTAGSSVDVSDAASPSKNGNKLQWYNDEVGGSPINSPKISLDEEGTFAFYVSEITPAGCEGERVKVQFEVTNSTKPITRDTTVCTNEIVDLSKLTSADEGNTLIWYDLDGKEIEQAPKVVSKNGGIFTSYVAQTDGVSVSEKAEITVNIIEVATLTTEDVSYCSGDKSEVITAQPIFLDCINCGMISGIDWTIGGNKLMEAVAPETNVTKGTIYNYEATPYYKISSNQICYGEPVELIVTVSHVDAPVVKSSINYTLSDTTDAGKFVSLTEQNASAVISLENHKLIWYDENGKLIGEEAPTPKADRKMDEDITLTYFVSQKDEDGCESEQAKVTVNISKTPVPTATSAYFCEGATPDITMEDLVKVSVEGYTLVWYDANPRDGGLEMSVPTINTKLKDSESVEETTTYYVAQTNGTSTSAAVPVEIHIYARPHLITHNDTVCAKPVNITSLWEVSKKVTTIYTKFYTGGRPVGIPEAVTETNTYNVQGYFIVPNSDEKCMSDLEDIYVEIHKLNNLTIDGPSSVCPGANVTLTANYDGDTYDSDITYEWNAENNSTKNGEFVSDALHEQKSFIVKASDGYCSKEVAKLVDIDKGVIDGTVTLSEENNEDSPITLLAGSNITFYSCGGEVTVAPDVKSTENDFEWSDGTTTKVLKVSEGGKYTLSYTNQCKTNFDVTIVAIPLEDLTIGEDPVLCEGDFTTLNLNFKCDENATILWKKDGTKLESSAENYLIERATSEDAGVYTYEISNRGCKVSGTYGTVSVHPAPEYTIKPTTVICAGTSTEIGLETLSPATAKVSWDESTTLVPAGNTAVATPLSNETYTLHITQDGGCEVKESIKLSVVQPIEFAISPTDTTLCQGSSAVKFAVKVTQGDVLSYEWKDDEGNIISTTSVYRASADEVGTHNYTVTLESQACDDAKATVSLNVVSNPVIESVAQVKYKDAEITVSEGTGSGSYEYAVDSEEFQTDNTITVKTYGKHTFTVKDDAGCVGTFDFELVAPDITLPVVVTPNGDGENDAFISEVLAEAYPNASVTIYDRYGKVVAKIPADEGWDGTYNGHKMPSTDYWYEIWIEEIRKSYVGHFTLIND